MSCTPCTDPCAPAEVLWRISQGSLFLHQLTIVDNRTGRRFDLTGYTVRCQLRRGTFESTTAAVAEATCTVVDAVRGKVQVKLGATVTKGMYDSGVFDVEVSSDIDAEEVYRVYQGRWSTSLEATLDGP